MRSIAFIILLTCIACKKDASTKTKAQLIEEAIEEKLDKVRARKMEKCKRDAMNSAIAHVDSLIAKEFSLNMIDTIQFPRAPRRPNIPGGKIILDTNKIKPIVD